LPDQVDAPGQVSRRQVGVAHGHGQRGVAQELLDGLQVGAGHDQPGSEGMPQVVETEIYDPGLFAGALEASADVAEPLALGPTGL